MVEWWDKGVTPSVSELQHLYDISNLVRNSHVDETIINECDDAGILCLPLAEYKEKIEKEFSLFESQDSEFLRSYVDRRVSGYMSPRRGASVGLRGYKYYDMMRQGGYEDIHEVFARSIKEDCDAFNFLARSAVPARYLNHIILEHIKNGVMRIMNSYLHMCLLEETEFSTHVWDSLDALARILWEYYLLNILEPNWVCKSTLSFREVIDLSSRIDDKYLWKVRELES